MRSLFALLSLVLASAAPQLFSMLETDRPGGLPWCETGVKNTLCEGATIGSNCRPFAVDRYDESFGTVANKLKSTTQSTINCGNEIGSDGAPCVTLFEQLVQTGSCRSHTIGWLF